MIKCIGLMSFETLVLMAGLFLFAYVKKNELGKWMQYLAVTISGFAGILIIGTAFCCMMCCGMGNGGCGGGKWNKGMNGSCDRHEMRGGDNCCKMNDDNCCKQGGDMGECKMGGMEKEIRIEINEDELGGKDTLEKKVIIRKGN